MKRIKLIWEFRGMQSKGTAEHHVIHINEFIAREKIEGTSTGVDVVNEFFHVAYIVSDESNLSILKEKLKPQKGFFVES